MKYLSDELAGPRWVFWLLVFVAALPSLKGLFFIACFEMGYWAGKTWRRRRTR